MILRSLQIGLLVFAALLSDYLLPVRVLNSPMLPSLLDMALLSVCLRLNGGEAVFWAGLIGVLQDDFSGGIVGMGVMTSASLALVAPLLFPTLRTSDGLIDRALCCFLLLMLLGAFRASWSMLSGLHSGGEYIGVLAGRLAATFLVFLIYQVVESVVVHWWSARNRYRESPL